MKKCVHEYWKPILSLQCSTVEKLVHAYRVPCACRYEWVIEETALRSNQQIHLEQLQEIAWDLQEVLDNGASVEKRQVHIVVN